MAVPIPHVTRLRPLFQLPTSFPLRTLRPPCQPAPGCTLTPQYALPSLPMPCPAKCCHQSLSPPARESFHRLAGPRGAWHRRLVVRKRIIVSSRRARYRRGRSCFGRAPLLLLLLLLLLLRILLLLLPVSRCKHGSHRVALSVSCAAVPGRRSP